MNRPVGPPDFFRPSGINGRGVRRLNRVPLLLVGGVVTVVASVFGYTLYQRDQAVHAQAEAAQAQPTFTTAADAVSVLANAPMEGAIPATSTVTPPPPVAVVAEPPPLQPSPRLTSDPAWQRHVQQQEQIDTAHLTALQSALNADPNLPRLPAPPAIPLGPGAGGPSPAPGFGGAHGREAEDPNGQAAKAAFLSKQPADSSNLLPTTREAPISPFEIRAGTVIPATMIGGVDSDLPGQIIAQVSENVFDTATGAHLLIPQGAKLVGSYDNTVTYGQERVLVVWNRIIFPDASALDIKGMPGADAGGYAGFSDEVDNHYARLFGSALMMSLFSAGIQLSQPQASNGQNYSSSQIIAGALGQQLGQAGLAMVQRNLGIAPSLTVRPGYLFSVMVTKGIVLPRPWGGER
jgi:type IV secretion system protein VirB10